MSANNYDLIRAIATYISPKKGGEGVARDVIEQVLKVQGRWMGEEAFGWVKNNAGNSVASKINI